MISPFRDDLSDNQCKTFVTAEEKKVNNYLPVKLFYRMCLYKNLNDQKLPKMLSLPFYENK
jgi:hypothetical protein